MHVKTYEERLRQKMKVLRWQAIHLDPILLFLLITLATIGLFVLYSAGNGSLSLIEQQGARLLLSFGLMILFAQIPPEKYREWSPWVFAIATILLISVLLVGKVYLGAKRWLSLGFIRFQPSEIMKLAMPLMIAWYLSKKELPIQINTLLVSCAFILTPFLLIAKQPDLGTAIIIFASGFFVILLAGLRLRVLAFMAGILAASSPLIWHFMHSYQKERVLTFLNPERDPLGSGYHIIQSKIALGSGGFLGKGWLNGTQSHLSFLPEHTTDFVFAVSAEEFGFIGCLIIIFIFLAIFLRVIYISTQAKNSFAKLLAGSLGLTFIFSVFINIGMVVGILPVVGIPLPLISYGGTSMMTIMISFGIIMSIHTHKKLWR